MHAPSCRHPYGACNCGEEAAKRTEPRVGDWMQTFTGKVFYPLDPRPDEIEPEDIAHALSLLCRYNGHTRLFYSVAEHCVHVSEWIESVSGPYDALWGLLHDATEAYVGDMIRPLKRHPDMKAYREAEDNLMAAICYRFGLDPAMPEVVKEADSRILLDERNMLMTMPPPKEWRQDEQGLKPLGADLQAMTPARARNEYWTRLTRLRQLVPQR